MLLIGRDPDPFFWKAGSRSVKKKHSDPKPCAGIFYSFYTKVNIKKSVLNIKVNPKISVLNTKVNTKISVLNTKVNS